MRQQAHAQMAKITGVCKTNAMVRPVREDVIKNKGTVGCTMIGGTANRLWIDLHVVRGCDRNSQNPAHLVAAACRGPFDSSWCSCDTRLAQALTST